MSGKFYGKNGWVLNDNSIEECCDIAQSIIENLQEAGISERKSTDLYGHVEKLIFERIRMAKEIAKLRLL